jgi:hypothetical protein
MDVGQVLSDLSDFSGVDLTIEPGAIQKIPTNARTVDLQVENMSIEQVLQRVSGFTGLKHSVNEQGVYIWNPAAGPGGSSSDPVVAILPLPESGVEVMLRQSDLSDDLRQYIRYRRGKAIDKLREMMKEEGFVPATTQPEATQQDEKPKDL